MNIEIGGVALADKKFCMNLCFPFCGSNVLAFHPVF